MTRSIFIILFLVIPTAVWGENPQPSAAVSVRPEVVAALIGAGVAIFTLLAKDFFLPLWQENRIRDRSHADIMRLYVAPLSIAAEKLVWRFKEIFVDSRHQFLKSSTLPLVYNEYKRKSTLFRIASLLGWTRAIQLELNSLPRAGGSLTTPILSAMESVKSALADGPEVEILRLDQLCELWQLGPVTESKKKRIATQFEVQLYSVAGDELRHDSSYLKRLCSERKLAVCEKLCDFLCAEIGRAKISNKVIAETMEQAVERLCYREALIYRDWQDAIGDSMLEKDEDSSRRYKVIGYEKFEKTLAGESLWLEVFRESIVDIDFDAIDPNDFRAKQLQDLATAVCNLIIEVGKTKDSDLISSATINAAKEVIALSKRANA